MPLTAYCYPKACSPVILSREIEVSPAIQTVLEHVGLSGGGVCVAFAEALPGPEKDALDALVDAHNLDALAMKSPDGSVWRVTVSNSGVLSAEKVV